MERQQRRLAAILAADVAGYSRLMEADEGGTLARFKLLRRDHIEPAISAHGGSIVGEAGDSLLVEFGSVSAAVTCAVAVQEKVAALNAEFPEDRRMRFRMGINLGEVVADGTTIHGDGVNVAARLERLAEPGGVVVAHAVQQQVKGRIPYRFEDLGEKTLHNIAEPVRVYRLALADRAPAPAEAKAVRRDRHATVAVLPFTSLSGDPELEHFADGITEDLITALSKARHLSVLARNSTFVFKGRSINIEEVGRDLGARWIVEGSVRKGEKRVRVTAQLIDAETGAHVWAERFDREPTDALAAQDEIVTAMAAQLTFSLIDASVESRNEAAAASLSAYDHVLRGRSAWRRGAVIETLNHYIKAVETDPNSTVGLASLAFFFAEDRLMQATGTSIEDEEALARDYAERALVRNDGDPFVHHLLGTAFVDLGELDKARHHLELARTLNPYYPKTIINLGYALAFMGAHRKGLDMIEVAFRLEPRLGPSSQVVLFFAHYLMRDYDSAIADFALFDNPFAYHYLLLAACYAQTGRKEEARSTVAAFGARRPDKFDVAGFVRVMCQMCRLVEDKEHWLDGFRKAELIP